jgi:hypothetical protein
LKKKFRRGRKRIVTGFTKKKKRVATMAEVKKINPFETNSQLAMKTKSINQE